MKRIALAVLVLMLVAPEGFAQTSPARSIAELARLVDAHPELLVTLASGERVKGRLDAIDSSRLLLRTDRDTRWVREADLTRIETPTRDSLLNGILIGAGVGGAIFYKYYLENALCQYNCQFVFGGVFLVGAGAGVGLAIDALKPSRKTLYERGPKTTVVFQVQTDGMALRILF